MRPRPEPWVWSWGLSNWDETELDGVAETRADNSVNELLSRTVGQEAQVSLSYDAAGNLVQDGDSDGDRRYLWDYRNRSQRGGGRRGPKPAAPSPARARSHAERNIDAPARQERDLNPACERGEQTGREGEARVPSCLHGQGGRV